MKVTFEVKTAAVILALASSLMLFTGCGKKIYSNPDMTSSATSSGNNGDIAYSELSTALSKYDASLNDYMHKHRSECKIKVVDDKTLGGIPCHSTFTVSPDNNYRILQQEKKYEDKTVVDEYFDLGEALFVARSTIYKNGEYDPVDKYYIAGKAVYKLDYASQSVIKLVDLGTDSANDIQKKLDLYFSFSDIMTKYA